MLEGDGALAPFHHGCKATTALSVRVVTLLNIPGLHSIPLHSQGD